MAGSRASSGTHPARRPRGASQEQVGRRSVAVGRHGRGRGRQVETQQPSNHAATPTRATATLPIRHCLSHCLGESAGALWRRGWCSGRACRSGALGVECFSVRMAARWGGQRGWRPRGRCWRGKKTMRMKGAGSLSTTGCGPRRITTLPSLSSVDLLHQSSTNLRQHPVPMCSTKNASGRGPRQ